MGRNRLPFNWDVVDALISLRASERYIAEYLLKKQTGVLSDQIDSKMIGRTVKLIQRRIQERWECNFVQYREQKQDDWKVELVQLQRKAAKEGKIAMQIWLGKQDLAQTDKINQKIEETSEVVHAYIPSNGSEANGD